MALSRTAKSALIVAFNCCGVLVYVIWRVASEPNKPPQFTVIEYGGSSLDLLFSVVFDYLILAIPVILILGMGSTLVCGILFWREIFSPALDMPSLKLTEPTGAKPNRQDRQDFQD